MSLVRYFLAKPELSRGVYRADKTLHVSLYQQLAFRSPSVTATDYLTVRGLPSKLATMRRYISTTVSLVFWLWAIIVSGLPNCPFPGAAFPKPTNLAASPTIQAALANLTTAFETYDETSSNNPNSTSWSIQIFSASSDEPLWEHYHTAQNLPEQEETANFTVGADTIYRLGSLTKIFTIMTFIAEAGDTRWNDPVTKYIPALKALAAKAQEDPVMNVDWESVTLGALASHMAGIMRDYALEGELTQEHNQTMLIGQGFPPAPLNEVPFCGEVIPCTRAQLFAGLSIIPPSFAPSQTPAYSNLGYQLLAYALEGITGKPFAQMLQTEILQKLGLNHTYYLRTPPAELGVIPPGNEMGWNFSLGEASPTGNMYSSISDLSRLGRAIFRSTILSPAQTRRWLKPVATTSDLSEGLSYPFGYRRIPLGTATSHAGLTHRIVDSYNKAGSINKYASLLILLPDYAVGFAALLAGDWPGNANWDMADVIGPILLPALESAAREQAEGIFSGTYTASHVNSSLVFSTDPEKPGLGLEKWISNGTDMIPVAGTYTLGSSSRASIRLFPTGLETTSIPTNENENGSEKKKKKKIAFKAMIETADKKDHSNSMFSTNCGTWVSQTVAVYADYPLDQFVFTVAVAEDGGEEEAESVMSLALRTALVRER
ncbi:beta-lactamase/transpeptidase-like protein [Xylaria bambusicola]|uniref:beta-lactamase/transpeptidase-like protein n=1 Tax=Xylaria bambusicola TaxID=326684 RepID=UPI0020080CE4|nr:beta-lactamase/transpeptidase-like protein [Xylaria bambusicola]KAI0514705.1 beta-lactamase/transpeptidase-like protein [Xylaria bambusicola]